MTILYITAFPPNSRSGGQAFSKNCIEHLSNRFFVDVVYFSYPEHECVSFDKVQNIKEFHPSAKNIFFHPFIFPLFTKRINPRILKYLKEIAPRYDVLYFDFTQVALYSLYIKHPCKIVRCHDIMAQKFSRKGKFFRSWIKGTEKKILNSVEYVFVPSKKDSEIVLHEYGIKAEYTNEYLHDFSFPSAIEDKKSFLFFGLWSRKENLDGLVWFIKDVFPLLKENIKNSLFVMGGGLSKENQEIYLKPNKINYLGFVEDSYARIVQSSAVIVPLFTGAGVKVKVLDSFTTGTPVIGTDVAFEGIPEISGLTNLVVSAEDFAAKMNNFVSCSLGQKISNANEFRKIYDNNHLDDRIQEIFKN